ncbi:MAG: serine/threonine protein kinase [Polyangiaceae bacterium]|nr:serine/threonine protein kinase [Polyangiaceae bacterium]
MTMAFDVLAGKTLLGRYRVVMPIGRGGMGTVYLARTEGAAGFAKPVVIKSVHADLLGDPMMVQLFAREARLLSNLHHPGVVNVLDFGEEDGMYVMVLEYVHGYDLGAWSRYRTQTQSPFPLSDGLFIVLSVLDTLAYTHNYQRPDGTKLSIVHRDISPGNILISLDGQVKLADFGIARAADDAGEYRSRIGTFKGKLAYSAPELVQGSEPTPSADLYSLAVVLLQILLGENPFKGQTMGETVQRVVALPPPHVSALRAGFSAELDRVLLRALAKNPAERFANAAEFAHTLRKLRKADDEHAFREFAQHVREDFDGGLPLLLDLDPLVDRDAAWRHEQAGTPVALSSTPPALVRRPHEVFDAPTAVVPAVASPSEAETARPPRQAARERRRARRRTIALATGSASLVLVVSFVILFFALRRGPAQLVEGSYYAGNTSSRPGPTLIPIDHDPMPAASTAAPSASSGKTEPTTAIATTLAERQPAIEACFEAHVEHLTGAPEIGLRFRLGADGSVQSAELSPPTLSNTPLGQCLLDVARTTQFPPLGRDLSFRLPITAHVSQ